MIADCSLKKHSITSLRSSSSSKLQFTVCLSGASVVRQLKSPRLESIGKVKFKIVFIGRFVYQPADERLLIDNKLTIQQCLPTVSARPIQTPTQPERLCDTTCVSSNKLAINLRLPIESLHDCHLKRSSSYITQMLLANAK